MVCSVENHAESEKLAALTKTGTTFMFVFVYGHGNEERPLFIAVFSLNAGFLRC